jgi:hypothetical protein
MCLSPYALAEAPFGWAPESNTVREHPCIPSIGMEKGLCRSSQLGRVKTACDMEWNAALWQIDRRGDYQLSVMGLDTM